MTEFFYRKLRSHIVFAIRSFFHERNFLEVETPSLVPVLIPERHINVFQACNGEYLIPSPEVSLKPLIANLDLPTHGNYAGVFELAHSFRKDEINDVIHRQEFIMLEWYGLQKNFLQSIQTCCELIFYIIKKEKSILKHYLPLWMANKKTCQKNICIMSMQEAFEKHAHINLLDLTNIKNVENMVKTFKIDLSNNQVQTYSWEDVFNYIFLQNVEPQLEKDKLCFLTHYPSRIPTLAAKDTNNSAWAQRWELYAGGMEIANCYTEETNAKEIQAFFNNQLSQKIHKTQGQRIKNAVYPQNYLQDIPLLPCSGVALGVDRLVALLCNNTQYFGI